MGVGSWFVVTNWLLLNAHTLASTIPTPHYGAVMIFFFVSLVVKIVNCNFPCFLDAVIVTAGRPSASAPWFGTFGRFV